MSSGLAPFSPPYWKEGWEELHAFFFSRLDALFHKIINFIPTDWFLIITIPPNIYKAWAKVQMEAWTWDQTSSSSHPLLYSAWQEAYQACLVSISHLLSTVDGPTFTREEAQVGPGNKLQAIGTGNFWKHLLLPLTKLYCVRQWGNL